MAASESPPAAPDPSPPRTPSPRRYGGDTWAGARALIHSDYEAMLRHFMAGERPSLARRIYWYLGAGAGLPVIGDDVVLAYGCMVIGGIQIGDRARIGPGAIVSRDVPPGAMVLGPASRVVRDCVGSGSAVHHLKDVA